MKIGMSSSCLYPVYTEESLKKLGENGVKTAEIFFNSYGELESDFVKQLKAIKERYDMDIISVHPTFSLAESFVYFSSYKRRYDEGMELYKRYAEIVCELGGKYIIMHGGKPNKVLTDTEYFDRFGEMNRIIKSMGAVILQENVVKFRAGNLDVLKNMSEYLGDDATFCLDIKQAIRGEYSPFDVLKVLKGKVKHLHVSDNLMPEKDCVLPLRGNFDFEKFFNTAKDEGFLGDAIVEVYSDCYKKEDELFSAYKKFREKFQNNS
ncbi:MAG: sugar phosphate isomerase/epimerase [Clostridia bacterium]|nr:sugar phosphate isomerase/epimerase [Clostridia bacterium]